jgi:GntR family transcriptional regulator
MAMPSLCSPNGACRRSLPSHDRRKGLKTPEKKSLTHCYYVIYTVVSVTNQRKSWLIGPISPAAGGTLYQQIVDRLKREVSEGRLKPGAALPSFRQLAEELLVSVITVKRAYEELEREGIIFRRQGLGTFVAEQGRDRSRETKLAAAKELLRDGFREAGEAGLKPSEILDLAHELLKEKK